MTHRIAITHNFETAHRLHSPNAAPKCQSIHGHSWWVTLELTSQTLDGDDMVFEFGALKAAWRGWLDANLDHTLVLRRGDPMGEAVRSVFPESRLFFTEQSPTTEVLSQALFEEAERIVAELCPPGRFVRVASIHLQETRVNAARYDGPDRGGAA